MQLCSFQAGLIALAKEYWSEMGPKGIRANAIAPGSIDTAMTQQLPEDIRKEWINKIPLRRGGTVDDIANCATFWLRICLLMSVVRSFRLMAV